MRKLFLVIAISGLVLGFSSKNVTAAHGGHEGEHAMTGALIDNVCGEKQKDEAEARKHEVKCSLKEACAASGYQLIVGDKHYKLTAKGNEKAKAYLEKAQSNHVVIVGKMDGDMMDVTSIRAAGHNHGGH